jgi:hypothetical protein
MLLLRKLGLVMWKNLLLRKRHWILTSFEIVIPVALFIVAAVLRSLITSSGYRLVEGQYKDVTGEETLKRNIQFDCANLLYAPNNSFTSYMMGNFTSDDLFVGK